jgi:small subunit ribosomal protein S4
VGRYTGPTERLSRREGIELELKGFRRLAGKSGLERRGPQPPGQHGMARRRPSRSVYALQLREKQRAKRFYGVRERQFRRYFDAASRRREGRAGERLLVLLESRLDNVVFRLGFASTRAQARQFVVHRHVLVNGRRCDIPSRALKAGDVVAIRAESPVRPSVEEATGLLARTPAWLLADHDALVGRVLRLPERAEIDVPVDEQLVVELLSRS